MWLIAFLAFGPTLSAADWYVSVTGNDANPGTLLLPWRTITRALEGVVNDDLPNPELAPGDVVHVLPGAYSPLLGEVFPVPLANGVRVEGPAADPRNGVPPTAIVSGDGLNVMFKNGGPLSPSTQLRYFKLSNYDATSNFASDVISFDIGADVVSPRIDYNEFEGLVCCASAISSRAGTGTWNSVIDQNLFTGTFISAIEMEGLGGTTTPTISNNTFSGVPYGVTFSASETGLGPSGTTILSPTITGNTFTGGSGAISFYVSLSGGMSGTAELRVEPVISGNNINTPGGTAIYMKVSACCGGGTGEVVDSAKILFAPQILNNPSITADTGVELSFTVSAGGSAQAKATPIISGNTFTGIGGTAITLSNTMYLYGGALGTASPTVSNNSISLTGGAEGISLSVTVSGNDTSQIVTAPTITGNQINGGNLGMEISQSIFLDETASANISPTVTGNTFNNVIGDPIALWIELSNNNSLPVVATTGTINGTLSNNTVSANGNGEGIQFSVSVNSMANVTVTRQVNNNRIMGQGGTSVSDNGIDIESFYFKNLSFSETLTLTGNTVDEAQGDGIVVYNSMGGGGGTGGIQFTISGNTATNNSGDGLFVTVSHSPGNYGQTILVSNNSVSNNNGAGMRVSLSGQAQLISNDVTITGNNIQANGIGGTLAVDQSVVRPNGLPPVNPGLVIWSDRWMPGGTPTNAILVSCNTVTGNYGNGVQHGGSLFVSSVLISPPPADFGGGNRNSPGGNKIFNNAIGTTPGFYDFYNRTLASAGTVKAENNWWGTTDPAVIDQHIHDDDENASLAPVDFTPFQVTARGCANTAPVSMNDAYATNMNTSLIVPAPGVLANDSDADGDAMTAARVSGPSFGTLTLNSNGGFTYIPNTGFFGTDSFTYVANDGSLNGNVATVTITVVQPNTAPVANNDSYATNENQTLMVVAPGVLGNDTDAQSNPVTAVLVSGPSSGTLTLNSDGSFTYTPNTNFSGNDSFTYKANDGSLDSNVATVNITVLDINAPPTANNDGYFTNQGTTLSVPAPGVLTNDTDPEGSTLTAVLVSGPSSGTLTFNGNGSFTYTPNPSFTGTDSFTYKASDGLALSNTAVVTISVSGNADLSVIKTATPNPVDPGGAIEYRIHVTNNGPGAATSITVVDTLPSNVTFVSTGGDFPSCSRSGNVLTCTLPSLAAAATAVLSVNVTAPTTGVGTLTNNASVSTSTTDPDTSNNTASVTTSVRSLPPPSCPSGATLLTPASGASEVPNPVTFTWSPVEGATGYTVFGTIDGGPLQEFGSTGATVTSLPVSLTGSDISWFVRAHLTSCPTVDSGSRRFTLEEPDSCDRHTAASLNGPIGNATSGSIVNYRWEPVLHANGYRVWVSVNGGAFAALETTQETTFQGIISKGNVEWFVEALFPGCPSTESVHGNFNVPAVSPCNNGPATPIAPVNNVTVTNQTITFSWQAAPNAIGYEVYLSLADGSHTLIGSTPANITSLQHDVAEGNLTWFVRALFAGCDAVDSQLANFVFAPPAGCPRVRPILTAPGEGATGLTSPVDFSWSPTPGAALYRLTYTVNGGTPVQLTTTFTEINDVDLGFAGAVEWTVDALTPNCHTLNSTPGTFTIVPPPPPCSAPETTDMRAAANASSGVAYTVRWDPIPGAVFYELQESTTPSFTTATLFFVPVTHQTFTHANSVGEPDVFYYRVRGVNNCNATRGLYSEPITVAILSIRQPDASPEGSTPVEDPQATTYQLQICTTPAPTCAFVASPGQSFTATSDKPWLTITPASGIVPADGITLLATAQPNGLSVGTNTATVRLFLSSAAASGRTVVQQTPGSNTATNISVNLVAPVAPTPNNTPPPDALIVPAVAHANGVNAHFESDIRVSNTSPQPMKYQLTFTPTGESGISEGKQATLDIDPGKTVGLEDVLDSWFGAETTGGATGSLEIRPLTKSAASVSSTAVSGLPNIVTFATSRTYSVAGNGSLGTIVPAIPYANFIGKSANVATPSVLSLQNIAQTSTHRTNLGLKEGSGQPASVLVSVFGASGEPLRQFTQNLTGGQHIQLNSVLAAQNLNNIADARIQVQVTSATGKVTAYASVVSNANNDAQLVSPISISQAGAAKYVLAGITELASSNTHTDVRLFNASGGSVTATLSAFAAGSTTPITKQVTLAGNEVRTLDVGEFFGSANLGNAAVHINTASPANLIATAHTYTETATGDLGKFINAVTPSNAVTAGSRPLQLLQIEESNRFSTEVGIAEVSGRPVDLEVTIIPQDSKVLAKTTVSLGANQYQSMPQLLKSVGMDGAYNVRVTVKVVGGSGAATAYAAVTDLLTRDPSYVPGQ